MHVVLISTRKLGRQPCGIDSPVAWLKQEGCTVTYLDLQALELKKASFLLKTLYFAIELPLMLVVFLRPDCAASVPRPQGPRLLSAGSSSQWY